MHNLTSHRAIGCTLSLLFHGRQPRSALDLRFQNEKLKKMTKVHDFTSQIQDDLNERFSEARESNLRAYYQYRQYYDRTNIFTVFVPIFNGFLPLSKIPKSTLHSILQDVALNENEQGSRLNLAIPMTSFIT